MFEAVARVCPLISAINRGWPRAILLPSANLISAIDEKQPLTTGSKKKAADANRIMYEEERRKKPSQLQKCRGRMARQVEDHTFQVQLKRISDTASCTEYVKASFYKNERYGSGRRRKLKFSTFQKICF
jgi:hypothetical protein